MVDSGEGLSQFELLQLLTLRKLGNCGCAGGPSTGAPEDISPAEVLRVVLILVDILGLDVDGPSLVPVVMQRLRTGLAR